MKRNRDELRENLRQRVVHLLHLGTVKPGDRLPSARRVAAQLGADPRGVTAAYRELERDGLVEVRPRSGVFVARGAGDPAAALPRRTARLVDLLVDEIADGLPAPEFVEHAGRCLESRRLRAVCIECNRDQIDGLCSELAEDYGVEAHGLEVAQLDRGAARRGALEGADFLVTTSFHAAPVRAAAAALEKPCIVVTLAAGFREGLVRLLREHPVYFVCVDRRFVAKLEMLFAGEPGACNLRPVVLGRGGRVEIPPDAPVLITRAASARLEDFLLLQRAFRRRVFSRESAREILALIVRENLA